MKRDSILFSIIIVLAISLFFCGGSLLEAKRENSAKSREGLDLKRALAYQEVQNLISAHTYCYEAQKQYYEIENFWAGRDDISYNSNTTREETINYYCKTNEQARKAKLEKMSELFPEEVENIEDNEGVGDMVIHLVTTPYIVVAGDCNTARGLWYVPSVNVEKDQAYSTRRVADWRPALPMAYDTWSD